MTTATAKRTLPGLFLAVLFAGNALAATPGLAPVEVRAIPIPAFLPGSSQTRFGALEYLGGLELNSRDPEFGSWSGLDFGADGRIYSIADTGLWLSARLVEDADGHLTGVNDTKLGAMRIDGGRLPQTKPTLRVCASDTMPAATRHWSPSNIRQLCESMPARTSPQPRRRASSCRPSCRISAPIRGWRG